MTIKLIQKHLVRGTQEFALVDDYVSIRTRARFRKTEEMRVMLTVLDPDPVISESYLNFNSRVNGEPLVSLFLGKPNTEAFNTFVNELKRQAQEAFHAFAGLRSATPPTGLNGNLHDEPAETEDIALDRRTKIRRTLDSTRLDEAVQMLRQYLDEEATQPLITVLEALKEDPKSEKLLAQAVNAFDGLGSRQGAVLTYAPYVSIVLSDDPFNW